MTDAANAPEDPGGTDSGGTETSAGSARPILVLQKLRRIFECFTLDEPELGLREIVNRTGLPPSTCQRLVQNLVSEGFLSKDGDVYRIGLGMVRWAAPGTYGLDLVKLAGPVLEELRDAAGETSFLQVRDGPHRTIVSLSEVRNVVIRRFMVGMVMPLHVGSAGKVFLAHDPDAWRDAIDSGLRSPEDNRVVSLEDLQREVAEVREAGYSATFEERAAGAGSLSAPVFDMAGTIAAAVGIGAPIQRFTEADAERIAPLVISAAKRLSASIGYRE
ncbi:MULTISPECIES: IclR family transcriptional regulator [Prauserella salsuginis group]|uniref:DNA-binding IclR family transcriptional regulator n=2 Tax=Prauserella salsuginis group TaxID=2893672 RepID=A0A839XXY2_9PSEU|nr:MULTISPECIES: IclR family transcriptional regulator [Prauserella salsuginis group]MBB3664625.1 DNA-binding IclR family transcriptional regulator [Prauserella sediminis]MCR3722073.1 transcriptional regulator, IclR family [Prauserella flava]MCR3736070.1 transcriptional regulator, IclR family [Prauserella salsuginis]